MSMLRALIIFALTPFLALAQADAPKGKQLFDLAVDYTTFQTIPGCYPDRPGALYFRCYDASQAYSAGLARAEAENRPLMVIWGFDECPACRYLESTEFNPAEPWMTKRFAQWALSPTQKASLGNDGQDLKILLLRINSRTPSGEKLAEDLGVDQMARDQGGRRIWSPFITMTHAETGKIVSQASMLPNQQPCNRWDEYALNLEGLGFIPADESYERRIC
jgi:hypothetical protein